MAVTSGTKVLQAVILAAGKSSRFKTGRTKLVEKICGREMVLYPIQVLAQLEIPTLMVVGFQRDIVEETVKDSFGSDVTFIHQEEQKGTGHAIQCTRDAWRAENILIMNGDMPLITAGILEKIIAKHLKTDAAITFATAHHCDPEAMYGRVIQANDKIEIIEAKDFSGDLSETCCVNAGIYLIKRSFLETHIDNLKNNNANKEWYITDLIKMASESKATVQTVPVPFDLIRGVNDFKELWAAEQIKKSEIIQYWMNNGVRFSIAHNVQIDWNVTIGSGSSIGSGVQLLSGTKIGKDCTVGAYSFLNKTIVGDRTLIHPHSIIDKSHVGSDAKVGPFSYVHDNSVLKDASVVGCFVEITRSDVGEYSKVKHLTYLGDTQLGSEVNIGAGTVACNYDGARKHRTIIKDNAFIGGNSTLIAPLTIHENAMTAAGSTITQDVPAGALGIGRERQVNKEGYALKIRATNLHAKNERKNETTENEASAAFETTRKKPFEKTA